MPRGKNIGGLSEETKEDFQVRKIRSKLPNHEAFMRRLLELYDKYNDQYEAELKGQEIPVP